MIEIWVISKYTVVKHGVLQSGFYRFLWVLTIKIPFSCEEKLNNAIKIEESVSGVEELHKIGIFPYMSRLDISGSVSSFKY